MNFVMHERNGLTIVEVVGEEVYIRNGQDALDLVANLFEGEMLYVLVRESQVDPAFFDLRTGVAGDILQKFVNYHVKVAVVGDFEKYQSQALRDLIYETNKGQDAFFVASVAEALERLAAAQ
jgi:hypothetical protein